jgi:hypothetical protein
MMIKAAIAGLALLALASAFIQVEREVETQYVPIAKRYPGLDFTVAGSAVTVELVYDVTCGASVLFDKKFREIVATLSKEHPGQFSYKYAFQILPYHISSFKISQAVKYVYNHKGPSAALEIVRYFFDTNETWVESGVIDQTISQTMDKVASEVSRLTELDEADIRKEIMHFSDTDYETRQWAKYAMGTLHASGTPYLCLNIGLSS